MQAITLNASDGAYIKFDYQGGFLCRSSGLEARYETYDGSGITVPGSYYLIDFDGSNATITPYTTQGYQQHGTTLQNIFLGEREITLKFLLLSTPNGFFANSAKFFYDIRKQVFDIMNPINGEFDIVYENDYSIRSIKARLESFPKEVETYGTGRIYEVKFLASEPFWHDDLEHTINLTKSTGGIKFGDSFLKFPSTDPQKFGTLTSSATFDYEGQAPSGLTIEFTTLSSCVNPVLTYIHGSTSKYVGINATVTPADSYKITTGYGEKRVMNGTTSAMSKLKAGSEFFQFEPGENVIGFTADSGFINISVTYNNMYVNP